MNTIQQRILDQATHLFFTYGYARVTVDEIAGELGISKKTLYKHFASKESLLLAVIEAFYTELRGEIGAVLADTGLDFVARLEGLVATLTPRLARIGAPQVAIQRDAPEVWARIETLRREVVFQPLTQLLTEGAQQGLLRAEIDRELLLTMLLNSLETLIRPEFLAQKPLSVADILKMALEVTLFGALTDSVRRERSKL